MAAVPVITLTTDFGLRDPFAGIMKGVILGICPAARLVDVSHDVAPGDVLEGTLALESAWRFFPAGTVHLAVVDPGVGSLRRALAVRSGGHYFIGPDNGLFTFALESDWDAVSIEAAEYRLPVVSRTFHGRDVFAPAAAHLAAGVALGRLGPVVTDPVRLALPAWRQEGADLLGEVIGSDRFGNLVTSIPGERVRAREAGMDVSVEVGGRSLGGLVDFYVEGAEGRAHPIVGSGGRLEIFTRNGSARLLLGAARGDAVRVTRRPAGSV